jgi:hypothetical protein
MEYEAAADRDAADQQTHQNPFGDHAASKHLF